MDKRIDKALELLKQAFVLLDEVAHDKDANDVCVRNVCNICGSMIRNIASSLVGLAG